MATDKLGIPGHGVEVQFCDAFPWLVMGDADPVGFWVAVPAAAAPETDAGLVSDGTYSSDRLEPRPDANESERWREGCER